MIDSPARRAVNDHNVSSVRHGEHRDGREHAASLIPMPGLPPRMEGSRPGVNYRVFANTQRVPSTDRYVRSLGIARQKI
jgi:hypothetical protein